MLPNPWTVLESSDANIFPIFVNSAPTSVMVTLTFQAVLANALPWMAYQYKPSGALGTFPYGTAIAEVYPGQTVTTVFDVPSTGRIYCARIPHRFGELAGLTYEVEDLLWGKG
jgi:hypothetical protein